MKRRVRPADGVYFRPPTAAEREIIDRARADILRGWDSGDENMQAAAYLTLCKVIDQMAIERPLVQRKYPVWLVQGPNRPANASQVKMPRGPKGAKKHE